MFASVNPTNNELLQSFEEFSDSQTSLCLQTAEQTYQQYWKSTSIAHRCAVLTKVAACLREKQAEYSQLISLEMGKPIAQAKAEVAKCATLCDYYAEHSPRFLQDRTIFEENKKGMITYAPIGAILGVMPWNFPFWQVMRFAIPALAAGNVVLLKHAPNVPQCALQLEQLFEEAIGQKGVFQNLFISIAQVREVIAHPIVEGIALTGSERAGASVAAIAGQHIKKCVLELGGADAFIVLEDADIPKAVQAALHSRMNNSGQTCISAKRLILVEEVADEFTQQFLQAIKTLKLGHPDDPSTTISCLARPDLLDNLERQVDDSIAQGAKVLLAGGRVANSLGNFFRPMLLADVKAGMPAFEEELFGPVAVIFRVKDEAEAIRLTNDTRYGLGASIWSKDEMRAGRLARQLEVGAVAINNFVRSDPRLPFGGTKRSGFGRELSEEGLKEFVNIKTIVIG